MKKGYYKIALGLALAAVVIALLVVFFRPRPIVSGDGNHVLVVWYIKDGQSVHLEDDMDDRDEEKILSYLETCCEQRNLFQSQTKFYRNDEIGLEIRMHVNGRLKTLYLGRNNYSDDGPGTVKWSIRNADEVRAAIYTMLGL